MKQPVEKVFGVIVPTRLRPMPDQYEMIVARVLAEKFQGDVRFIERSSIKTPDVQVLRTLEYWEIKNIRGNGKLTIEDNLRKAAKQANNVVISLLRSEMSPEKASSYIKWHLKHAHVNIRHVILITKRRKVVDFYP